MTIPILERVNPSLPDDLSRWLIEVQAGTLVSKLNEVVQEALWETGTALRGRWSGAAAIGYQLRAGVGAFI